MSDTDLEALRGALARGESIRKHFAGGGRIYIDRPQPFLCVYRRPSDRRDPGTRALLRGGASYVFVPKTEGSSSWPQRLVSVIAAELAAIFGAAIVVEIWATTDATEPERGQHVNQPSFRIVSGAAASPTQTLETLERAIVAAHWPGGKPRLAIDYLENTGPPGCASLLGKDAPQEAKVTSLGLELAPIWRDPESSMVYPEVLRSMRAALWHALREAFFTFIHTHATYRPEHYHELGPRAMTPLVGDVDRALAAVSDSYDLLLHVTPVNAAAAWAQFEAGGCRCAPEFHYRPLHVDPSELKRSLYAIPLDDIEDPALHSLFAMKRDELDRQITMLGDRESPRFVLESLQIYGRAAPGLKRLAHSLLEHPLDTATAPGETLDAEAFATAAREELDYYLEQHSGLASAVVVSDTVPGIMVSSEKLFIGRYATVEVARVNATLQHEIGTHWLTYCNGLAQPFQQLHAGLAGYEELQEGLAVLAEYLVGGLSARRMRVLAARVIAVESVAEGADFGETFGILVNDYGFFPRMAYTITMRVHRAGGFSKDVIYLRGLVRLLDFLAGGGDHAELLVGKVSFPQLEVIRELRWRRIIDVPRLMPRYLQQPGCRERLQRARDGLSVTDLLDG